MSGSLSGAVQIGLDSTRISSCPVLSRWVASWYRRRLFYPSPACLPMHACLSALSSFFSSLAIAHKCEKAHALPPRTKNKQQKNFTSWPTVVVRQKEEANHRCSPTPVPHHCPRSEAKAPSPWGRELSRPSRRPPLLSHDADEKQIRPKTEKPEVSLTTRQPPRAIWRRLRPK